MPQPTTRRTFLGRSALASAALAAPTIVPASVLGKSGNVPPSEQLTLGVIGMGRRCTYDMKSILKLDEVRCLAISEVQASRRAAGKKLVDEAYGNQDCQLHRDFREMLERKDIDTVLIATGDRWHGLASILAAEAGKDVYSEKPCGLTIEICQQVNETFKRTGRIFQAGTQRRSVPHFIQAAELAHSGKLGKIHTLYASAYTPQIRTEWLPRQKTPDPAVCDWNLWLGPAPWRPFNQGYVNGDWRGYWDFDSGARLLDWTAHTVDLCQWANRSDDTMPITYESSEAGIECHYANGVKLIIDFLKEPFGNRDPHYITRLGTCPVRFVGDEGSVETGDMGEVVVKPDALAKGLPKIERVRGLDVSAHAKNFFESVRTRKPAVCNSTVMRRSHIASHAAALSWILDRKITIDPKTETFVNDEEANLLRGRVARESWKA